MHPDPVFDGRQSENREDLIALAASLEQNGLINPITVRLADNGYSVIAGRRRVAAARLAGWTTIPAIFRHCDDRAAQTTTAIENLHRSNLSPIEQAQLLASMLEASPGGVDAIAIQLSRPVSWILNRLDLLALPPDIQTAINNRQLSITAASTLARIPDPQTRSIRLQQALHHGCSAQTAQLWLQDALGTATQQTDPSEKPAQTPPITYTSTTTTQCFTCQQPKDINDTLAVRICHQCIHDITQAAEQQPHQQH